MFHNVSQYAIQKEKITCDEMDFMFNALSVEPGYKDINLGSSDDSPTIKTAWRIKKPQWATAH